MKAVPWLGRCLFPKRYDVAGRGWLSAGDERAQKKATSKGRLWKHVVGC